MLNNEYDCDAVVYTTISSVLVINLFLIVCARYEILRGFHEMVSCITFNFTAYCLIVTARYRDRNAYSQPFVSPKLSESHFSPGLPIS